MESRDKIQTSAPRGSLRRLLKRKMKPDLYKAISDVFEEYYQEILHYLQTEDMIGNANDYIKTLCEKSETVEDLIYFGFYHENSLKGSVFWLNFIGEKKIEDEKENDTFQEFMHKVNVDYNDKHLKVVIPFDDLLEISGANYIELAMILMDSETRAELLAEFVAGLSVDSNKSIKSIEAIVETKDKAVIFNLGTHIVEEGEEETKDG